MTKAQKLDVIRATGVIAIMRADSSDALLSAAGAIRRGGVRAIEVTMTTPGALDVIAAATRGTAHGGGAATAGGAANRAAPARGGSAAGEADVLFGAGSVLDPETARAAILAGASFIVAPALSVETIALCNRYGVPVIPGVFTPTEALAAIEAGAPMVKLFPAELGGPRLVAALRAPLPQLEIIPVGGVDLSNAAEYIRAGAAALGVGSSLINQKLLDAGDVQEIERRAAAFIAAVAEARRPAAGVKREADAELRPGAQRAGGATRPRGGAGGRDDDNPGGGRGAAP